MKKGKHEFIAQASIAFMVFEAQGATLPAAAQRAVDTAAALWNELEKRGHVQ